MLNEIRQSQMGKYHILFVPWIYWGEETVPEIAKTLEVNQHPAAPNYQVDQRKAGFNRGYTFLSISYILGMSLTNDFD